MKKVYYEAGPDQISVGPINAPVMLKRGEPTEVSDAFAASLLKKPMFKEAKDSKINTNTAEREAQKA